MQLKNVVFRCISLIRYHLIKNGKEVKHVEVNGGAEVWGRGPVRGGPGLNQELVVRMCLLSRYLLVICNLVMLFHMLYIPYLLLCVIYIIFFYSIMFPEPTAIRLSCCSRMEEKRELRRYLPNTTKTKKWVLIS